MIVVFKKSADEAQIKRALSLAVSRGASVDLTVGKEGAQARISDLCGDFDARSLVRDPAVEGVYGEPETEFRSRISRGEKVVVRAGGASIGDGFCVIAGPCAVESEEGLFRIARAVKAAGADVLRGGAFKPRTSPYSFRGLGEEGLKMLVSAGREFGLPVVSEITDPRQIDLFHETDIIQIGARNAQNYELLREVGRSGRPVLLKRGYAMTVGEWLSAAEYVLAEGNENVILCERGIRAAGESARFTLDLAAVAELKTGVRLPVIVDPSHAGGKADIVAPLCLAAAAVGADGIMVEVHDAPETALSDGAQAILPETLAEVSARARKVREASS